MNREPLDSILSGGGEAVSEQTAERTEADATQAGEGESLHAQRSEGWPEGATEADAAEAQGDGATRMVPHQALHAERQRSRRYSEEVADFRRQLGETNARMAQLVEAVTPRQAPPAPPDFFDNPEAATRFEVAQTVSPAFERINQTLHSFARENAVHRFTQGTVDEAEQAFIGALQSGRLDPADYRRVVGSPNRYAEAVRWHQRQVARAEIGDDPAAYKARVEAELRERILAELGDGQAQPRFPLTPSNLAGARNVGGRRGPAWSGPASLNDIFDRRRPG
ncbi:hypothetical protein [Bradyrhizobium sp. LHD-71]|uniref:hypothetical protein n=1 Tax=Bradyrhizobium sp. LHD-71 TaxID=3072141 RepID=UPI0028105F4F|nr:hypothetical protein [Bradyrhizobium sp. LHD-71]MDQ8730509.1 hypothetical protein [Bradyrhizobium sp. LHD-71]